MTRFQNTSIGIVALALATFLGGCAGTRTTRAPIATPIVPVEVRGWELLDAIEPAVHFAKARDRKRWNEAWRALHADQLYHARSTAAELVKSHPSEPSVLVLQGLVSLRAGLSVAAVDQLKRAEERADRDAERIAARRGLVLAAMSAGLLEDAYEGLEALRSRDASDPLATAFHTTVRLELAERWLTRARSATADDPLAASDAYAEVLRYAPESSELLLEMASVLERAGRADRAEAAAARAVRLDPTNVRALSLHARILVHAGKLQEALSVYEQAEALQPFDQSIADERRKLARQLELTQPPAQYDAIVASKRIRREQLAALVYVELSELLEDHPRRPVIVTDIDDSWARPFIIETLALGIWRPRANHTFGPSEPVRYREFRSVLRRTAALLQRPVELQEGACSPPVVDAAVVIDGASPRSFVAGSVALEAIARLERALPCAASTSTAAR